MRSRWSASSIPTKRTASKSLRESAPPAFSDYHEVLDRVDAAVIATPTRLHHAVALDFLARGVHVLVEKPLASAALKPATWWPPPVAASACCKSATWNDSIRPGPRPLARRSRAALYRSGSRGQLFLSLDRHRRRARPDDSRSGPGIVFGGRAAGKRRSRGHVATGASRRSGQCPADVRRWLRGHAFGLARQPSARAFDADLDRGAAWPAWTSPPAPARCCARAKRCCDTKSTSNVSRLRNGPHLKDNLADHLPVERIEAQPIDAITAELQDFSESIRTGRMPRVSGEQAQRAVEVAEQIVDTIAQQSSSPAVLEQIPFNGPGIIPSPHFISKLARQPNVRREAG